MEKDEKKPQGPKKPWRRRHIGKWKTLGRDTPKNGRLVYFSAGGAQLLARSRGLINASSSYIDRWYIFF